ncbi:hypothetical protein B0H14DRAFT_3458948 [Mycena olivaceomarginata]|nr:hypothetical protein B0H14DRAFT_3458948 [Mycena olivaceomarginata]
MFADESVLPLDGKLATSPIWWLPQTLYWWLTGHSDSAAQPTPDPVSAPTTAELEDGAVPPAYNLAVLKVEGASTPLPHAQSPSTSTFSATAPAITCGKILLLFISAAFFDWQFSTTGVISLEQPLLENVAAMALYVLCGWEVVFVFGVVAMAVAWRKQQRQVELDTAPTEVLLKGTLPDKEQLETPVKKENDLSERKLYE